MPGDWAPLPDRLRSCRAMRVKLSNLASFAAGDSLVMTAAGAAVHGCRGRRRGGSASRRRSLTLVFLGVCRFPRLRPLSGLGSSPGAQSSTVDLGGQHTGGRTPLVWASATMGRTLAKMILVAALLWFPAAAQAQIVAPAGRTLFNRNVLIRSF